MNNFLRPPLLNPQQVVPFFMFYRISYKPSLELSIYKSNELESTFIETLNHKKSNIIISCI